MTTASLEYIAAGGNRHSSAADWAPSLLAFGAGNNIALWDPENERQNGISALLAGHEDAVNAVRIYENDGKRVIISGSADKTIRIWTATNETRSGFEETQRLTEHSNSINTLAVFPEHDIFVSGSADASVNVWHMQDSTAKLIQTISLKPRYLPLALALTSLTNGDIVLAVAGTSNNIQLYVRAKSGQNFELQATLSGHEGWIRSLDFTKESDSPESDILLASASQDKYIRLWRFQQTAGQATEAPDTIDELSATSAKKSLSNKAHQVGSSSTKYAVTFEALLVGHEDWIYTARWEPKGSSRSPPALLSASADNSLSVWHSDAASGLWICHSRMGEISSQKGSTTATGSAGGFWIGLWQPQGRSVVSLGRTGSWRRWNFDENSDMWLQQVGISGHVQEVQGIAWSPRGDYLLSTSSDQTTRLISEWKRRDKSSWHEMARPQIHGYDLNCIDAITDIQFISGADEKLLRVFNKPKAVDNLISKLSGTSSTVSGDLPDAANIPVLGLSNKAMAAADDDDQPNGHSNGDTDEREAVDPASVVHKSTLDLDHPPHEDHLARHTLWPEHEKLYGHGYEISAVATSNDKSLVATACKASSLDHAVIRLYETKEWREVKPPLTAHSLSVTSLAFSPDDRFLLSVGRDRQWAVFERDAHENDTYKLFSSNPKGHSRMILDCCWAPASAGHVFATAGRDKSVKLWRLSESTFETVSTITTGTSVTAVAFSSDLETSSFVLAYGCDDGSVHVAKISPETLAVHDTLALDPGIVHCKTINALRWRPRLTQGGEKIASLMQLASASDDFSIRIYNIT
ncbi:hypothetical protein M409DRAFT_28618 [Zasmidium cellare ATCC 36951]|uniref:Elongator complex protein 2 n=1 Tax=Zasmidium cellare ATCC 36951 TaxID=1080233 RepID=A0A6A6C1W4_ZASCE|nr:uncharacterized protein M409DRAFT_28618 [Zasmidium cellare ATCC 36951]KAF2161011.1 hypothetical protein M409DRAFT_28618 [Zasmidium cellare ATCC 36951]